MKRQSRIAVALFAGASLILAACGGDDGGDTTEAPTSEAPTSEAPANSATAMRDCFFMCVSPSRNMDPAGSEIRCAG